MSAAFTPGLWEAIGDDERVEADTIPVKVGEHQVADVYGWPTAERPDMTIAEAEANARLIAAAPELYEACADMVRLASMSLEESLREPEENGNYAAFTRAKAAIAKARGDQ